MREPRTVSVIPAKAGIQLLGQRRKGSWIPAFAGMTPRESVR